MFLSLFVSFLKSFLLAKINDFTVPVKNGEGSTAKHSYDLSIYI